MCGEQAIIIKITCLFEHVNSMRSDCFPAFCIIIVILIFILIIIIIMVICIIIIIITILSQHFYLYTKTPSEPTAFPCSTSLSSLSSSQSFYGANTFFLPADNIRPVCLHYHHHYHNYRHNYHHYHFTCPCRKHQACVPSLSSSLL